MQLKHTEQSRQYTFYWSPEGRKLGVYIGTRKQTLAQFRREFPQYARFIGEVYREISDVPVTVAAVSTQEVSDNV